MPACESKLVSRSSRKATVAKTVLGRPRSCECKPSLVGDRGPVMPACEGKLVSRSSRKATVAKTVLNG